MRVFFFVILLFCIHACPAQQRLQYDSSSVDTRNFSAEKINAYNNNSDFQYNRYKEPPRSVWDRFWSWFWNKIGELFSNADGANIFNIILVVLAVLATAFFIYKLTGMNRAGLFKRKGGDALAYSVTDEDIHSINFEAAINQAIENHDYRLAVRLLYLQSLKKLTDKNLINWQLNKTNIAYVQELAGRPYQFSFSNLTLQFESNWYGDMPIDAGAFEAVREQFNQFNQLL